MMDRIGQEMGHYRLVRLLGVGGFASVYLGQHLYLHTSAAIKVLSTRLAKDDVEQLLRLLPLLLQDPPPRQPRRRRQPLILPLDGAWPFLIH